MNCDQFKDFMLAALPNARLAAGGKEITTTCPFCGKEGHLYISVPTETKPPMYNCFRCEEFGKVNSYFLSKFSIFDDTIIAFLKGYKGQSSNGSIGYNKVSNKFYLRIPVADPNPVNLKKLAYINNRLGINLTLEDLAKNKIVLDLQDLLSFNSITKYTRDPRIVEALSNYFLGFVSMDNGYINMRKLTSIQMHKSLEKRYVNYNIANSDNNHRRYYIIPTRIYPMETVKVHIAEGPFDILSIKYNVVNTWENSIFIAGCGKSYLNVIQLLLEDIGLLDMEIHLYMDNDNPIENALKIVEFLKPFHIPFYIHNNIYQDEKDYGVPKERIIDNFKVIM